MDIIRAQKMEFRLGPCADGRWWRCSRRHTEGSAAGGGGASTGAVDSTLFLFLSFSNKIRHLKDEILLWWCHTKTQESKTVRKVGSKETLIGSPPLRAGLHQGVCVRVCLYMVSGWGVSVTSVCATAHRAYRKRVNSQILASWKRNTWLLGQCHWNTNSEPCVILF